MRGGTSRGPFFRSDWLPDEPDERDKVLLQAMGSPHEPVSYTHLTLPTIYSV